MTTGCASVAPMSGYIGRNDHPYKLQMMAGFEKVVSSTMYALKSNGWTVVNEGDPSVYEQDERYDNNGYANVLMMTNIKKDVRTFSHLNVFIHSLGQTCEVEVRYEARTPMIKEFVSVRNDRVVENVLNAIQEEVFK